MTKPRFSGWLVSLCLALGSAAVARAQDRPDPAAKPPAVLFVGNSFLHGKYPAVRQYNAGSVVDENFKLPPDDPRAEKVESGPYGGIPGLFKKFADEAGVPCEVHVEAVSAKSLEFHYEHALPVIAQARWDAVVLQDYSTGPLPEARGGKPARFFKNATLLEQAVHAANPHAWVYLYATWPRADLTYPANAPYAGEPITAMARDLHDAYYREFAGDARFAGVAPVGDAWLRAIQAGVAQADPSLPSQDDKIDLWGADDHHPSAEGAYLSALVLFQRITGKDAQSLGPGEQAAADLGIDPADAATLRRIASEQIAASDRP